MTLSPKLQKQLDKVQTLIQQELQLETVSKKPTLMDDCREILDSDWVKKDNCQGMDDPEGVIQFLERQIQFENTYEDLSEKAMVFMDTIKGYKRRYDRRRK